MSRAKIRLRFPRDAAPVTRRYHRVKLERRRYVVARGKGGFWWIGLQDAAKPGKWVPHKRHLTKRAAWGVACRLARKNVAQALLVDRPDRLMQEAEEVT